MNDTHAMMLDTTNPFEPREERPYVTIRETSVTDGTSSSLRGRVIAMPSESSNQAHDQTRVFVVPSVPAFQDRVFHLLQRWEGRIIRVEDHDFTAILTDKTNPSNPDEEVVIDRDEVPEDDQNLLQPGAMFYWSIGYEEGPGRPRRRVSQIRLRRLPRWTKRELEELKKKAEKLADLFL